MCTTASFPNRSTRAQERAPGRPAVGRSRWAAVGAAVAITVGAGGIGLVEATVDDGDRPVLVAIDPCRIVDTRDTSDIGPRHTPIEAGETYEVAAHGTNGDCTIPAEAIGLSLNVTATQASELTNMRIFPSDATLPLTSNLNPSPGSPPVPNSVTTGLDSAGMFSIYNEFGAVDVVVDINGYYEDHTHDDRYYTEAEVDAAVEAAVDGVVKAEDGRLGYAWVCGGASVAAIGVPTDLTTGCGSGQNAFNSSGGGVTVTHTNEGQYQVVFEDLVLNLGNIQVTSTGNSQTNCKVNAWSGLTGSVSVLCRDEAGVADDGPFNVMAIG